MKHNPRTWQSLGRYDVAALSDATGTDTGTETPVQQQFAREVDINTIVKRFGLTGELPGANNARGIFGDFTGLEDMESVLARADDVRERFMTLPAELREQFGNNPFEMARQLYYASDKDLEPLFGKKEADAPPPSAGNEPAKDDGGVKDGA